MLNRIRVESFTGSGDELTVLKVVFVSRIAWGWRSWGEENDMVTHGLDFRELARCWSVQVPHVDQLGNRHLGHGDADQEVAWKYLLPSSLVIKKRLHLHIKCFLQFLINVSWPFWSKNDPSLNMSQSPISQGMCFQILGALHIKAFKKLYIQKALKSLTYTSFTY